jgi:hypothetical protein
MRGTRLTLCGLQRTRTLPGQPLMCALRLGWYASRAALGRLLISRWGRLSAREHSCTGPCLAMRFVGHALAAATLSCG